MKTNLTINQFLTVLAFCMISIPTSTVFAQGSLTPTGAPGPTMKTLDQIEARTPISSVPYTISSPGSYYLTGNLTVSTGDAITITSDNVTLDLNGFTIASSRQTAVTDTAILLSGVRKNVAISNGHIFSRVLFSGGTYSGSGFGYGIYYTGGNPVNVRVKDVSVVGVLYHGIYLPSAASTVVSSCAVDVAGGYGIVADSVSDSTAYNCGTTAILAATASNCYGQSSTSSGLYANSAANCYGYSSSGLGLDAFNASNCYGYSNGGAGVNARVASNCYGQSSSGIGLSAKTASNCYGYSSSGTGLSAFVANTCIGFRTGGTAIFATIGIGCYAESGTISITNKYDMP